VVWLLFAGGINRRYTSGEAVGDAAAGTSDR
jgi:hypothetical protein